jgi:hypothetical protein
LCKDALELVVGTQRTLHTKSRSLSYGVPDRCSAAVLEASNWTYGSRGKAIVLQGSNHGWRDASAFEHIMAGDGQTVLPERAELLLSKPSSLPHLFLQWEQTRDAIALKVDLVARQDLLSDLRYFDLFFAGYYNIARSWELHRAPAALELDDLVFARSRLRFEAPTATLQDIARDFVLMWTRLASDHRVLCDSFPILDLRVQNSYDRAFYNWLTTHGLCNDYVDSFPVTNYSI